MVRTIQAMLMVLSLLVVACSPPAATGSAELGSTLDDAPTPSATPTATIEEIAPVPGIVIVPTPIPDGPRPLVVVTLLGEENSVMAPLDGPALAGIVAEVDRLNDEGGVLGREIELRRFDTNSRTSLAERLANQLLENPPDLIITSCDTAFSQPVLEIADEHGLLTISPCAEDVRYLTGGLGSLNFTLGAPEETRGELAAESALALYGTTTIVLRDETSPEALAFCDGFERRFRELGGSVIYRDEFRYDTLEPVHDRLAERDRVSDFITVCSHVPGGMAGAPSVIAMLRTSLGFQAPIVAGSSVDEPGWFALVPSLGEMTFVSWSSAFGNDPDDRVNDLVRRVQQNGETPGAGVSTILGAETIEAWARAVVAAGDAAPERVAAALGSFNNEPFSTGEISFLAGARMDLGRTYRVLRVTNGELSVIGLETTPDQ